MSVVSAKPKSVIADVMSRKSTKYSPNAFSRKRSMPSARPVSVTTSETTMFVSSATANHASQCASGRMPICFIASRTLRSFSIVMNCIWITKLNITTTYRNDGA